MKSFKPSEIDEAIKYIRNLDVEEQFDQVEIDPKTYDIIIASNQLTKPTMFWRRWSKEDEIIISDAVEQILYRKSKFLFAFKYLKDLVDKSGKFEHDYDEKEDQARVLIEDLKNGRDYVFILELDENRETLVSVCLKVESYQDGFFETRVFTSEEKMHLGKVKEMLDEFEAALK